MFTSVYLSSYFHFTPVLKKIKQFLKNTYKFKSILEMHLRNLMESTKIVVQLKKLTQIVKQAYLLILPAFNTGMQQAQASLYLFRRKMAVTQEKFIRVGPLNNAVTVYRLYYQPIQPAVPFKLPVESCARERNSYMEPGGVAPTFGQGPELLF
jgi:hypothetical protein